MENLPETRYAKSGDTYIAYQVMGEGPLDVVMVPGFALKGIPGSWNLYAAN